MNFPLIIRKINRLNPFSAKCRNTPQFELNYDSSGLINNYDRSMKTDTVNTDMCSIVDVTHLSIFTIILLKLFI